MRHLIAPAICLWAAAGCSLRTAAVRVTAGALERGAPALRREPDARLAREALPGQLKLLEALLENDPENRALLTALAEGFAGYAFLFVEDEDPGRGAALYRRAGGYGARALAEGVLKGLRNPSPEAMRAALAEAGGGDVPALYWTAMAWAGWANLDKNDPEALAALPKAARLMERVLELDPGFQFGGPDLFFGVYYAARPRIAGGDPEKARAHFESALARSGRRFLTGQLLYAKFHAVATLDEELFRSLLEETLAADPAALPEARLANEVARTKSRKLLERADELF